MKSTKLFLVSSATAVMCMAASPAMAIFDAQVLLGKRWYEFDADGEKSGISAQEIGLAAHIDPIPVVPVAFGASLSMVDLKEADYEGDISEAAIFEPSLEVMAWIPMVPIVTPYARLKIPVMATYALKTKDNGAADPAQVVSGSVSGYHLNAGIKWSPLPIVKLLLEVGMGSEKVKIEEVKIDGAKVDLDAEDVKAPSKAFLLGVEIGL